MPIFLYKQQFSIWSMYSVMCHNYTFRRQSVVVFFLKHDPDKEAEELNNRNYNSREQITR